LEGADLSTRSGFAPSTTHLSSHLLTSQILALGSS
jgi:hypothetical protein